MRPGCRPLTPREQRRVDRGDMSVCYQCGRAKRPAQFGRDADGSLQRRCLDCMAERKRRDRRRRLRRQLELAAQWTDPEAALPE